MLHATGVARMATFQRTAGTIQHRQNHWKTGGQMTKQKPATHMDVPAVEGPIMYFQSVMPIIPWMV